MEKVLVCLLANTRASDLAFPSFKRYVLDELNADLALALTIDGYYNYANPLWQHAKYRWTACDYADYGDGFDWAQRLLCDQYNVIAPNWRPLLRLRGQWGGRIRSSNPHPTASSIMPFCRWLLLRGLLNDEVLDRYERFIISRSDFFWLCPHPPLSVLNPDHIWIPDGQHWGGLNDRHMIVSRANIVSALNGLEDILLRPGELYEEMKHKAEWNNEQFLSHLFRRNGLLAKIQVFPYIMYLARSARDKSLTYSTGRYEPSVGHFVKYEEEFRDARALATFIHTGADWRTKAWIGFNPATVSIPKGSIFDRMWYRCESTRVWFVSQLKRPNQIKRVFRFLMKTLRLGTRDPARNIPPGSSTDWSRERAV